MLVNLSDILRVRGLSSDVVSTPMLNATLTSLLGVLKHSIFTVLKSIHRKQSQTLCGGVLLKVSKSSVKTVFVSSSCIALALYCCRSNVTRNLVTVRIYDSFTLSAN